MSVRWMKARIEYLSTIRPRWTEQEEVEYFTLMRLLREQG